MSNNSLLWLLVSEIFSIKFVLIKCFVQLYVGGYRLHVLIYISQFIFTPQ